MPALLLAVAISVREGRLLKQAPGQQGTVLKAWGELCVFSANFQEPAGSSLPGLTAEKTGPRTTLLAGRPQGNESYRAGVRSILAAREAVLPCV